MTEPLMMNTWMLFWYLIDLWHKTSFSPGMITLNGLYLLVSSLVLTVWQSLKVLLLLNDSFWTRLFISQFVLFLFGFRYKFCILFGVWGIATMMCSSAASCVEIQRNSFIISQLSSYCIGKKSSCAMNLPDNAIKLTPLQPPSKVPNGVNLKLSAWFLPSIAHKREYVICAMNSIDDEPFLAKNVLAMWQKLIWGCFAWYMWSVDFLAQPGSQCALGALMMHWQMLDVSTILVNGASVWCWLMPHQCPNNALRPWSYHSDVFYSMLRMIFDNENVMSAPCGSLPSCVLTPMASKWFLRNVMIN